MIVAHEAKQGLEKNMSTVPKKTSEVWVNHLEAVRNATVIFKVLHPLNDMFVGLFVNLRYGTGLS